MIDDTGALRSGLAMKEVEEMLDDSLAVYLFTLAGFTTPHQKALAFLDLPQRRDWSSRLQNI
jgi:hypothetical protein